MKLAKRIFAGLVTAVIAVSCFTLSTFAEVPTISSYEIENVLEYYTGEDYLVEDFEDYGAGDYVYAPLCPDCGKRLDSVITTSRGQKVVHYQHNEENKGDCSFPKTSAASFVGSCEFIKGRAIDIDKTVITEGDNQILEIVNRQGSYVRYSVSPKGTKEKFVVSFRVKTDNEEFYSPSVNLGFYGAGADGTEEPPELNNGSNVSIFLYDQSKNKRDFFSMNCHDMTNPMFYYFAYDESNDVESERYVLQSMADLKPQLNTWYSIELVVDCNKGVFELKVTPDGQDTVSTGEQSIGQITSYTGINLEIEDGIYAGTKTWFDDINLLEGTFVRDSSQRERVTANYILALENLLNDENTSVDDKVRIADVYKELFGTIGYVTTDETTEKTSAEIRGQIDTIISDYAETVTDTYVDAYLTYAAGIADVSGYYNRVKYVEGPITRFVEVFNDSVLAGGAEALQTEFPGIDATDIENLGKANAAYVKELGAIERVRIDSESFFKYVSGYDALNTDYKYMLTQETGMNLFVNCDPTYKFVVGDAEADDAAIKSVADLIAIKDALTAKIASISTAADAFKSYVSAMASAEDFKGLYDNYLLAKATYNDGVIHEALDNSTYDGVLEAIEIFLEREIYVNARAKESEEFIYYVDRAEKSTYYTAKLEELNKAALYIDSNKEELSIEKSYPGVAEAEALYASIKAELEANVANAEKFIAAVNAIANADSFATKKAAVEHAMSLKVDSTGIAGVKEANEKLYVADGEIKSLEGYSQMLIDTVAKLKSAKTLEERRQYIFAAKACIDHCEKSIAGVSQAISDLEALTNQFNADIAAINSAFAAVKSNSGVVTSGAKAN